MRPRHSAPACSAFVFALGLVLGLIAAAAPAAAQSARRLSGMPSTDPTVPAGTLAVRVVADTMSAPIAGIKVTLVGYATDGSVTVAAQPTDADGFARFAKLDTTGGTLYYAMALVPRGGGGVVDRLTATPAQLDPAVGSRVILAAEARRSKVPAQDDLGDHSRHSAPLAVPGRGRIEVTLSHVQDPTNRIDLVDAATRKVVDTIELAGGASTGGFALGKRAGQVLYAETTLRGRVVRSFPFQAIEAGTAIELWMVPTPLVRMKIHLYRSGPDELTGQLLFNLRHYSWIPLRIDALPLPRGAAGAELRPADRPLASIVPAGAALVAPLQPGERDLGIVLKLRATRGKVHWQQVLPYGLLDGSVLLYTDPGSSLGAIVGATVAKTDAGTTAGPLMIAPKHALDFEVTLGAMSAAEAALLQACTEMNPNRNNALLGKRAPALKARAVDGTPVDLALLRGKLVIVNFTASWTPPAFEEVPTLNSVGPSDAVLVIVASEATPTRIRELQPWGHLISDDSGNLHPDHRIGPLTKAWGIEKLPETFVIDRSGVVRLHFISNRDWSTPGAAACLRAVR